MIRLLKMNSAGGVEIKLTVVGSESPRADGQIQLPGTPYRPGSYIRLGDPASSPGVRPLRGVVAGKGRTKSLAARLASRMPYSARVINAASRRI